MTLSDLASLGSFVSGIAVVVSLIYLSLQVRHAHKTQRALMHQARTDRVVNSSLTSMDPVIAETVTKAVCAGTLSARETMQLYYYMRIQVAVVEDALWQHQAGFLDKESLDTAVITFQRVMLFPACRVAWFMMRPQLAPALRDRMDKIVAESVAAEPVDWTDHFNAAQAQVKAMAPTPKERVSSA